MGLALRGSVGLGVFLALMVAAPFIVRMAERAGHEGMAKAVAYVGYTWQGFIFLFVMSALVADFMWIIALLSGAFNARAALGEALRPTGRMQVAGLVVLCVGLCVYAFNEARSIRVERITINSARVAQPVRMVQISDVHLGLMTSPERVARMVALVNGLAPDVIVATGDVVDGQADGLAALAGPMSALSAPMGKFAVTGNHETYAGIEHSIEFMERAGFTVLRNEYRTVAGLVLAGVDYDPSRGKQTVGYQHEPELLQRVPPVGYRVLLKHVPQVRKDSEGKFDLQLSGHTHKGQIFPFTLIVRMFFKHIAGMYDLPGGGELYVSRGTGTWGPPMRLMAPPEVAVFELRPDGTGK